MPEGCGLKLRAFQTICGEGKGFIQVLGFIYFPLYYQLKMSQENMWVMIYFFPSFTDFQPYQLGLMQVQPKNKVEEEKREEKQQMIKSNLQANMEMRHSKLRTMDKHSKNLLEDSSFEVPVRQESKIAEQKLGRNSVSNILRLFTKLLKTVLMRQKFEKIKERFNFQVSSKEFNSWINCIGLNTNKYIRIKKVINGIKSKPHLGRIVGIFYALFESQFARTAILTSSKTESKNVAPTLSQIRNIKKEINSAVQMGLKKAMENQQNVFD